MNDLPPLPTLPITSKETLRKCRELPVGSKDIFVCSFPKSGTTWMQNIVYQLLTANHDAKDELPFEHISQYAPFYEIDAHWEESTDKLIPKIRTAQEALGWRIFNTHLRWDMLPKSNINGQGAKYIYVVRDGRDVLTSFYHHMTNQHVDDGGFEGDFEAFFQQFLDGTIAYGKWSHHLASWMPHCVGDKEASNPQILLVRYEHMKQNLKEQISRIAAFLQLDGILADQDKTGSLMNRVLERSSFSYMREHQQLFHPVSVRWKAGYNFIRKGSVGDHDTLFDEAHRTKFMKSVQEDLRGGDNGDEVPEWLNRYFFHT